jgi:hypothetical protein
MLDFVMIGLICNSLGCYWAPMSDQRIYHDQNECINAARDRKQKSMMYFDANCLVDPQGILKK